MYKTNTGYNEDLTKRAGEFARKKMRHLGSSHGWDHVERVSALAKRIAVAEDADLFIVSLSALLHDIAREIEDRRKGKVCHAELGAKMAYEFLIENELEANQAMRVADCIRTHRFRNDIRPTTIEAMTIYDADKLDSIGAIGIGRAFLFSGEVGAKLHNPDIDILTTHSYSEEDTAHREFMVKLQYIKDKMFTSEGRRLAEKRHDFMKCFFDELHGEITGNM